jgi:hypothetical protein
MQKYDVLIIAADSRGKNVFPKDLARYVEEWNLVLNDELEILNVTIKGSGSAYELQSISNREQTSNYYRGTNAWYPTDVVKHNILSALEGFNIDRRTKLEKEEHLLNRVYISRVGDMGIRNVAELQSRLAYLLNLNVTNIIFDW